MPEDRDFDRMIDAALGTYADSSADANLADRVLSRLANEPAPQPRLRWLPWTAVALPAGVCLLWLIHFGPGITRRHVAPPIQSARLRHPAAISTRPYPHPAPGVETAQQINRATPHPHPAAVATAQQPLPKLDVFPTPTPLTRQERALAMYVAHTPQAAQQALARSEQEQVPLTVASIHVLQVESIPVMPLEAPDEGANTN